MFCGELSLGSNPNDFDSIPVMRSTSTSTVRIESPISVEESCWLHQLSEAFCASLASGPTFLTISFT